jgi:hypothetical protein
MRMSDMGWVGYVSLVEEVNYGRCIRHAEKHGFTAERAEECDEDHPLCPDCPFKTKGSDMK